MKIVVASASYKGSITNIEAAKIGQKQKSRVIAIADNVDEALYKHSLFKDIRILSIVPRVVSLEEAMKKGKKFLYYATEQVLKLYKDAGKN